MKTILLETNAINSCLNNSLSGAELLAILNKKNLTPIVNIHTKYELARTFLNPKANDRGKKLFLILKELKPLFSCPTDELIKREIQKLKDDIGVTFICNSLSLEQIQKDITLLSEGKFVSEMKTFIEKREREIAAFLPIYDKLNTVENREVLKNKSYADCVKTYINLNNIEELRTHLNKIIEKPLTYTEVRKFLANAASYPAINTHLRIDLYLHYTTVKSSNKPAKDKTDDLRHLIDASYCSILVTNDVRLTSIAHQISPEIEILTFEDLLKL